MTLDELSNAWNELRNDALGRGTSPKVSAKLAKRVEREYRQWRAAREDFSKWGSLKVEIFGSAVLRGWVARYRKLRAEVKAEGVLVTDALPVTSMETAMRGIDKFNHSVAVGLGAGGLILLGGYAVYRASRNGGR